MAAFQALFSIEKVAISIEIHSATDFTERLLAIPEQGPGLVVCISIYPVLSLRKTNAKVIILNTTIPFILRKNRSKPFIVL